MASNQSTSSSSLPRVLASYAVLLAGLAASVIASSRAGGDYAPVHLTSVGVLTGAPIYHRAFQLQVFPVEYPGNLPQGMFYPPATGVAMLPLGFLPFKLALPAWFALTLVTLMVGVRALVRAVRPDLEASAWRFAVGGVLFCSAVRWGLAPGQGAPLMLGVSCLFLAMLWRNRLRWAVALAAFALAFKFTLAVPFLGLLFLWRSYRGLVACIAVWVGSNVIGMARVGGMAAFRDYHQNIGQVEAFGDINTPDPWDPISVPRTDLTYLSYGIVRNLTLAGGLAKLACGIVALILVWVAWRIGPKPSVRQLFGVSLSATCLGALVVYHHHYDLAVMVAPVLLLLLARGQVGLRRNQWLLLAPILTMLAFLPIAASQRIIIATLGLQGLTLLNFTFPVVTLLALVVGMQVLVERPGRESSDVVAS